MFLSCLIICLSACGFSFSNGIKLPETSTLIDIKKFAVILDTYVLVHAEKDSASKESLYLRRGDLVSILSREREENTNNIWLHIEAEGVSGWIENTSVDLYDSKEKALLAIQALK